MAGPALGGGLPDRVPRRAGRQDPRPRRRSQQAAYLAIGVNGDGEREVLGSWFEQTEGAKFWLSILTELKQRGVHDVLVCCVDGLKGFPEAIETVWPHAVIQTCVVHLIRHSLRYVAYRDKKKVASDLKAIYTAPGAEAALPSSTSSPGAGGEVPDDLRQLESQLGARHPVPGVPPEIYAAWSTPQMPWVQVVCSV